MKKRAIVKKKKKAVKKNKKKTSSKRVESKKAKKAKKVKRAKRFPRFSKKQIPKLRFGVIHSTFNKIDGVSIVMKQIEGVLIKKLKVDPKNIFYYIGKAEVKKTPNITIDETIYHKNDVGNMIVEEYEEGYGGRFSELIESSISQTQKNLEEFIKKNKIDVIIAHNTCYPVNLIAAVALSRYYRNKIKAGEKTPKYLLWWHDSHFERKVFEKPSNDVKRYLLQGVPGKHVEYILFINSTQFEDAQKYLLELDEEKPGYFEQMRLNKDVVYNTTDKFLNSFKDVYSSELNSRVETFLEDFKIGKKLRKKNCSLDDVMFCLQHTRLVKRKRIDFALKYCYELLLKLRKKGLYKTLYFFVSGHEDNITRESLIKVNKKLQKEYNCSSLLLAFAEDCKKTDLKFEEYPRIFAKLGAFSTYFSEIEGFGNNLLEVMASGLIPVIYTYPVFIKDIKKYRFKVISLKKFEVDEESLKSTIEIITKTNKRKEWVNKNLKILDKHFSHTIISRKLKRAIIRRRMHN